MSGRFGQDVRYSEVARYGKIVVEEDPDRRIYYVLPPNERRVRFSSETEARHYAKSLYEIIERYR
jgi:hypothetical protein